MAETKTVTEREYIIPLRREWMKVANYKRGRRSVMTIKSFIAKHMRVVDRDLDKVKLDKYLNNEIWFRGARSPPSKIKVRAIKEGDIVRVQLAEMPAIVKFAKAREERLHKKIDKKKVEVKTEEKKDERTEEEKKEEVAKEKSVQDAQTKALDTAAKTQKHVTKAKGESFHRMALKK